MSEGRPESESPAKSEAAREGGFIPKRYEVVVFSFFLSMFMSLLVSGIATARALGVSGAFLEALPGTFLSSWIVAFPAVLVVAPLVRKLVALLVVK